MPTGYTAQLIEAKQPLSLRQFALICARAFGACATMRDVGTSVPAPKKFKADTSYHDKALRKAISMLKRLSKMTEERRKTYNLKERKKHIKIHEELIKECQEKDARLVDMRAQVEAWTPDSAVAALKTFMLQQIEASTGSSDYYEECLKNVKTRDFYTAAIQSAKKDIEYYVKERQAEIDRTNERNAWLRALRDSLPNN